MFTAGLEPGDQAAGWVRPPSDVEYNSLPYDFIPEPKTLVRTLVNANANIDLVAFGGTIDLAFGIIAMTSDGTDAVPANFPNVFSGAYDWVYYAHIREANRSGLAAWYNVYNYGGDVGNWIESKAMRKLPANTGLLGIVGFDSNDPSTYCTFDAPIRMGLKGDVTAVGLGGG